MGQHIPPQLAVLLIAGSSIWDQKSKRQQDQAFPQDGIVLTLSYTPFTGTHLSTLGHRELSFKKECFIHVCIPPNTWQTEIQQMSNDAALAMHLVNCISVSEQKREW